MLLHRLILQNVRNYPAFALDFHANLTFIVGPNAIGKTNIIESVYTVATGSPFRGDHDAELIMWGEEVARLKARLEDDEVELLITSGIVANQKAPKKKYLVNNVPRRMIDFTGRIPVVLFWPEDLLLVVGSPSGRRTYLNSVLSQIDRDYRRSVSIYEKALRQRNMLLRKIHDGLADRAQLPYWDQLLIREGSYLTQKRTEFIEYVNSLPKESPGFEVIYDKSLISSARLEQYSLEEIASKTTLVGPHRDDIQFLIEQRGSMRDLSLYGSRGEQRLGVLWLKLSQVLYTEKECSLRPLLLLDDIFSELDESNRKKVLTTIMEHQTVMTSADDDTLRLVTEYVKAPKILELGVK